MARAYLRGADPPQPLGCDGGFAYVVGKREEATMTIEERLDQMERRNRRLTAANQHVRHHPRRR